MVNYRIQDLGALAYIDLHTLRRAFDIHQAKALRIWDDDPSNGDYN